VVATLAFLPMAAALGLGNGAVFAMVGQRVPRRSGRQRDRGGRMGLVFKGTGDYAIGLMLLSDVALAGLVFTAWRLGRDRTADRPSGTPVTTR
jgi:MFS transporter, NNP family, nitrate/nitrite transporter